MVEHVQDEHVVAAEAEMLEPIDHPHRIVEQVRDEHDHPALRQRVRELMQRPAGVGLRPSRQAIQGEEQRAKVARTDARLQPSENMVVEGHEPGGVTLSGHEIGERRGQARPYSRFVITPEP